MQDLDSLESKNKIIINNKKHHFYDLKKAAKKLGINLNELPHVIKIIFENLLRKEDGKNVTLDSIKNLLKYFQDDVGNEEILFHPSRVLMQDFTGVPAVVDLAAMRDALNAKGINPEIINPQIPVDLVIDHSVQIDKFGSPDSYSKNIEYEFQRNNERYKFLKWGQESFKNFRVIPPGKGICHQVNLEYLADVVSCQEVDGENVAYFDTVVGTDSHTTMINGLSILGWGVGGIEAEAAMLGQPISLSIPKVVGFKLKGKLNEGVTATDLVLTITEMLRQKNVVGKFVEFFGPGLKTLSLFERATIANMAPEYGATCGYFPIDEEVIKYLNITGRNQSQIDLVEQYAKEQCIWEEGHEENNKKFNEQYELDISQVKSCIAGPKRPQDRILLSELRSKKEDKNNANLKDGDIVISAITSCTNTSNPYVLIGAGLLAKRAYDLGLKTKTWVKTSLAPGSQVVTEYLIMSGLIYYLEKLGFYIVGYGCTTCIGNSGPLLKDVEESIKSNNLSVSAILSGNRNFEGRIHPLVKQNYLASPMLCVAFALVGTININLLEEAIGIDNKTGKEIFLKDIWPTEDEIQRYVDGIITRDMFIEKYNDILDGDEKWKEININKTTCYAWQKDSTYIKKPPFFENSHSNSSVKNIENARILAILGDSVTTDHISPAGSIAANHSAGRYLIEKGIKQENFNSFGSRRGNDEIMVRGTFANIRIKNKIVNGKEGGFTKHFDKNNNDTLTTIYDASQKYINDNVPLVIFAGKEYGTGSSRDWAAKGTKLLGIKAVIAESFERIHRSNLIGMGVLPLQFIDTTLDSLLLKGDETISLIDYNKVTPKGLIECQIKRKGEILKNIKVLSRIDTQIELDYFLNNGILNYVLKKFY